MVLLHNIEDVLRFYTFSSRFSCSAAHLPQTHQTIATHVEMLQKPIERHRVAFQLVEEENVITTSREVFRDLVNVLIISTYV